MAVAVIISIGSGSAVDGSSKCGVHRAASGCLQFPSTV